MDWRTADRTDSAIVAAHVRRWVDAVPDSPLYRTLALAASADDEMLRLIARIDGVPPMNLLFAAVKLHLSSADALAAWYPHLTDSPRTPGRAAYEAFREYALAHAERIVRIGAERRTQTNEVARAAVLLPWLAAAAGDAPVHAVDLGASAGLNLCLDQFAYRYVDAHHPTRELARVGTGRIGLTCEVRGAVPLPRRIPLLASRTGIDLSPVDPTEPANAAWLEALVWPEHTERLTRLRAALAIRRDTPVTMVAGDAATQLERVAARLPDGPMLVWHTVALYQADARQRSDIDAALERIARHRIVARVGFEPVTGSRHSQVRVGMAFDAAPPVAVAHSHGKWIDGSPGALQQ